MSTAIAAEMGDAIGSGAASAVRLRPADRARLRLPGVVRRLIGFALHGLEMCVAMCIGAAVLDPVYLWAAGRAGYSNPLLQLPELSLLAVSLNMTLPMVAWMRVRGMDWRSIAEMSAARTTRTRKATPTTSTMIQCRPAREREVAHDQHRCGHAAHAGPI